MKKCDGLSTNWRFAIWRPRISLMILSAPSTNRAALMAIEAQGFAANGAGCRGFSMESRSNYLQAFGVLA